MNEYEYLADHRNYRPSGADPRTQTLDEWTAEMHAADERMRKALADSERTFMGRWRETVAHVTDEGERQKLLYLIEFRHPVTGARFFDDNGAMVAHNLFHEIARVGGYAVNMIRDDYADIGARTGLLTVERGDNGDTYSLTLP